MRQIRTVSPEDLPHYLAYAVMKQRRPECICAGAHYTLVDATEDNRFMRSTNSQKVLRYHLYQRAAGDGMPVQEWSFKTIDAIQWLLTFLAADPDARAFPTIPPAMEQRFDALFPADQDSQAKIDELMATKANFAAVMAAERRLDPDAGKNLAEAITQIDARIAKLASSRSTVPPTTVRNSRVTPGVTP